jgi:4-oxalocrotonate tautomerase
MPHVIVKLLAGRSEEQKSRLAEQITQAVIAIAQCAEPSVSVSIQDIAPGRWTEDVYNTDIIGNWATLYKKPGYTPT